MKAEGASSGARLLVVDDEAALMQALCSTLQQQGFDTTGCTSAEQALERLRGERFDLLLTDLMMPVTDGLALARAALALDPQMVAVMMTGQGSIATAVEAMQSGVLDYVLKPFKLGHMLPVLERALSIGRLRRENADLQEKLRQHTRELETANGALEAYAATVSHDLRAPLRGIDGLIELLAQRLPSPLPAPAQQVLDLVRSQARRAQRLIDDLLRLSRIGRQTLARSEVDFATLAAEVLAEMQGELGPTAVDVVIDPSPHPTLADISLLRQAVVNLLGNALKFAGREPAPRVHVGSDWVDGERVYSVADNGPGFDMQQADRLFLPFERLAGAEAFEGSGVGLSIVQRIVQRHGGRIWAVAAPGRGAAFHFTLGEPTDPAARAAPAGPGSGPGPGQGPRSA